MRKLLTAGIRRYIHSIAFWIAVCITVVLASACGYGARRYYVNLYYILAELVINAVLISWMVGREHEEGIFRNKIIAGHSKGRIFLSELIIASEVSVLLDLLFMTVFLCFNGYLLGHAPADLCLRLFFASLVASICEAALFVTISCLIPYRAASVAVNMVLIAISLLAAFNIKKALNEPEFIEFNKETYWTVGQRDDSESGEGKLIGNADYVEEPVRSLLTALYRISPCVNIVEGYNLTYRWFGYDMVNRIDPYHENGFTWDTMADFTVTDDENQSLNIDLLCNFLETVVICCTGFFWFRKKEIK